MFEATTRECGGFNNAVAETAFQLNRLGMRAEVP